MFTFLHAADIHLDSPLIGLARYEGAPADEIRNATRVALENLVTLAIERQVAFVILAGDIYDGDWKDYKTGLFFVACMTRLRERGIEVFLAAGNHDATSQISKGLKLPDNVHRFSSAKVETLTLDDHEVALHGRSYPNRRVDEDLSEAYPKPVAGMLNIGVLHTSLDGRPGHAPYAPCTLAGLRAKGYAYWALGHVHEHEFVSKDPWVVFPGNTQGRHANETGRKGCVLVNAEDGEILDVERCDLDAMRWVRRVLDVSAARDMEQVVDSVGDAISQLAEDAGDRLVAVRIELSGATAAHRGLLIHREQLVNEVRARAIDLGRDRVWVEKVVLSTSPSRVSASDESLEMAELSQLIRPVDELVADWALGEELEEAIKTLKGKVAGVLPATGEGAGPDLASPEARRALVAAAREIVLAGLSGERR